MEWVEADLLAQSNTGGTLFIISFRCNCASVCQKAFQLHVVVVYGAARYIIFSLSSHTLRAQGRVCFRTAPLELVFTLSMRCLNPGPLTDWKLGCHWPTLPPDSIGEINKRPEHSPGSTQEEPWQDQKLAISLFLPINCWHVKMCNNNTSVSVSFNKAFEHGSAIYTEGHLHRHLHSLCSNEETSDRWCKCTFLHTLCIKDNNDFFSKGEG